MIETQTTINAIWNTLSAHLFLERTALRIGSIENGEVAILTSLHGFDTFDFLTDNNGLLLIRISLFENEFFALVVAAKYIFVNLSTVMLNQTVGSLNDALCRTIILLKLEKFGFFVNRLEIENIINVGSSESVNALCVIAYNANAAVFACQLQNDALLHVIGILVLVN